MKKQLLILLLINSFAFGQVGIGNVDPKTALDVTGGLSLREGTPLALLNGVNNNFSLGTTPSSFYRVTNPTAAFSITGLAPATSADGQIVTIENATAFTLTIVNEGITSIAINRIYCPGNTDLVLNTQYSTVTLSYNASQFRWIVIGSTGSKQSTTTTINESFPSLDLYTGDGYNLGTGGWSYAGWTPTTVLSRNIISNGGSGSYYSPTATTITNLSLNGWLLISSGSYNVNVTIYIMKYSLGTTSTLFTNNITGTTLNSQNIVLNTANTIYPVTINVPSANLLAGDVILCWIVRNNGNANARTFEFGGQLQFNQ